MEIHYYVVTTVTGETVMVEPRGVVAVMSSYAQYWHHYLLEKETLYEFSLYSDISYSVDQPIYEFAVYVKSVC